MKGRGTIVAVVAAGVLAAAGVLLWRYSPGALSPEGAPADAGTDAAPRDAGPSPRAETVERPDVIVISVDTLRADHLGAWGYEDIETPAIDRLAEQGVRFERATVPLPRTTPALVSLLTGLWPQHHGSREVWEPIENGTTLAELLSERGWAAVGVSANPAAGPNQEIDRGFDPFVPHKELEPPVAGVVTERALALAGHADPDKPLLLWAHYLDPHWPYDPPDEWDEAPKAPACRKLRRRHNKGAIMGNLGGISEDAIAHCTDLYDAEIEYNDAKIGELLEGLDELGRLDNAYVVFTADHGENLGEDNLYYEHGPNVHDASMRVPLIVKGPGIAEGRVDRGVARIEDVMPTLVSLLGIASLERPEMDGADLSPRLREGSDTQLLDAERYAFAESGGALHIRLYDYIISGHADRRHCINHDRYSLCLRKTGKGEWYDHEEDPTLQEPLDDVPARIERTLLEAADQWKPETARERTVRALDFKLVERPKIAGGYERVLYDLREDSGATRDVSREHPEVMRRLGARLDAWLETLPSHEAPERDDRELEQLRALGYVE